MKSTLFLSLFSLSTAASAATISNLSVRQRWPFSQKVDIDFSLEADTSQRISVELYSGETKLNIPEGAFFGGTIVAPGGVRTIVFDPLKTAYTNQVLTGLRFVLTPSEVPLYMIVDLKKSAGADGQIEYIYPGDSRLETYGRFTNVWFGVTNNSVYATDKLVLRRVHAGTFLMGDSVPPTISTTLTKEFYAGVFEVTQRQWELITGARPSQFSNSTYYKTRPVEKVSYEDIRGATNDTPAVNWPTTDRTVVSTNSFLGKLRAKTGLTDIDLPTLAQGECLCRAGTTTYYNDNGATPGNTTSNAQMDVLGRYQYNGGRVWNVSSLTWREPLPGCGATNGTATVGTYLPNGWGLYDTHGNVWEWCLDFFEQPAGGLDPSGPVSGTLRRMRGGCWYDPASESRSGKRECNTPSSRFNVLGFRLVRTLP